MKVSWDDDSQYIMENKIHVPNHQPVGGVTGQTNRMVTHYITHVSLDSIGLNKYAPFFVVFSFSIKLLLFSYTFSLSQVLDIDLLYHVLDGILGQHLGFK